MAGFKALQSIIEDLSPQFSQTLEQSLLTHLQAEFKNVHLTEKDFGNLKKDSVAQITRAQQLNAHQKNWMISQLNLALQKFSEQMNLHKTLVQNNHLKKKLSEIQHNIERFKKQKRKERHAQEEIEEAIEQEDDEQHKKALTTVKRRVPEPDPEEACEECHEISPPSFTPLLKKKRLEQSPTGLNPLYATTAPSLNEPITGWKNDPSINPRTIARPRRDS